MLAPMAVRMSRCPNIVRTGTTKIPLAMPSMPPRVLAPSEPTNSHKPNEESISLRFLPSPGQAGHEPDHVFFFQAEDGIRDHCVTGVQTCALPICGSMHCGRTHFTLA